MAGNKGANLKLAYSTALVLLVIVSSIAAAETLSGTVTNGTISKPSAGDEVIVFNLSNGMEEAGKTKTDDAGKFSLTVTGGAGPHLVRAIHQGVTYHQMAPPGTKSVEIQVFDVAKTLPEISITADVMRFQADGGQLQGTRLFAVENQSSPPRTQMNDHNFEFYLPAGAKIDQAMAKAPNGQPIAAEAVPQSEKDRYAIVFPLRPGETTLQIEYTMPYSGSITVDPKPLYPAQHLVVVLPKSMHFAPADASLFQSMQDPNQGDTIVQVAQQTKAGQSLGFTVSGTGTISEAPSQAASNTASQQGGGGGDANRPGGGLGAPIEAPDPLDKYRWFILGGFALVLVGGAMAVMRRQPVAAVGGGMPAAMPAAMAASVPDASTRAPLAAAPAQASTAGVAASPSDHSSMLLLALKEELFQLEIERRQGKLSTEEYEKAKTALDQTLDRALRRQSS